MRIHTWEGRFGRAQGAEGSLGLFSMWELRKIQKARPLAGVYFINQGEIMNNKRNIVLWMALWEIIAPHLANYIDRLVRKYLGKR